MDQQADWHNQLVAAVQRNCHIADARHAGDYTLCIYLLKMREFFRWEQGISLQQVLTSDDLGDWLTGREALWDALEEADYSLPEAIDPFDNEGLNARLNSHGLVYSAGYGRRCRPLFFLGQLLDTVHTDDYTILMSGRELARDLEAPPAMNQGKLIFIRQESLRRMLWEKVEEWRWSGLDNPMGRAIACYDFAADAEAALEAMLAVETRTVIAHEIGEIKAGQLLGDAAWQDMLFGLPPSQADIMLRAVRDHLADALHTLPVLLEANNPASLHFYFGNLTAMRKQLAPELVAAYQYWNKHGDTRRIADWAEQSREHWLEKGQAALKLYAEQGREAAKAIEGALG